MIVGRGQSVNSVTDIYCDILGDKINAKVDDLIKNEHHPRVFSELEEFHHTKENGLDKVEWKETARWVKFEEDVEAGGDRWSKPHVGTLSLHSFYELEKNLKSGGVFLDAEASSLEEVNEILLQYIKEKVCLIIERTIFRYFMSLSLILSSVDQAATVKT